VEKNEWTRFEFEFDNAYNEDKASFALSFRARAELKIGALSLLPVNSFHGMRPDVVQLLKQMGPGLMRWPGGNYSGEYNWKDGLLPVDMRAPRLSYMPAETQPHTMGFDFHEFGIDDFIALCRETGAEPYITVNLAWNSPEVSAQLVEYCNGGPKTEWGAKRIARGFKESYNVKVWSLGNEFGHGHMQGLNTADEYAAKAMATARAMKAVTPDLTLFSSGPFTPERDPKPWIKTMLPKIADEINFVSYHAYQWYLVHGADFTTDAGIRKTWDIVTSAPEAWLEKFRELRSLLNEQNCAKIGISFDEWNVFFAWYQRPGIIEGIFTALVLEMVCAHSEELNIPVCMYFQPVNEGAIVVKKERSFLTSDGQVFTLMHKHGGGKRVIVDTGDPDLRCVASRHGEEILFTFINSSFDKKLEFKLEKKGGVKSAILFDGSAAPWPASLFAEKGLPANEESWCIPPRSIIQLVQAV
jgi:alpha-N-arabinofuranosidase